MADPKVVHSTFVLERNFPKPPQAVFAALSQPEKVRRWHGEGQHHDVLEFSLNFQEDGTQLLKYRMKEGSPIAGALIVNESRFLQIVPNERIVTAGTMKFGDQAFSASQVTFELLPDGNGTQLICTHQGAFFEHSDGPKMREAGWNALLDKLAAELEA